MLELTSLEKTYGGFDFGPVDITVKSEVLSVLGPSGSGKTTLLSLIAGMIDSDSGTISLNGRVLEDTPIEERRTGLVFQEGALFPHMTARENIQYAATDSSRVDALTSLLEIGEIVNQRPPRLSGGERQRIALARTLAADPDVLLLDEPLSSLDAPIRRRLRHDLADLLGSLDVPVVYVTHDQRTATALGDRLAVFHDGSIEQVGPPSTVLNRPATRFVARFTGTENTLKASVVNRNEGVTTVEIGDIRLKTLSTDSPKTEVTACIHPSRIWLTMAAGESSLSRDNTISGRISDWLNVGTQYRLSIDIDGISDQIVMTAQPSVFEQLKMESGYDLQVTIPPEAIHLI